MKKRLPGWFTWLVLPILLVSSITFMGATLGYLSSQQTQAETANQQRVLLDEQFELGVKNLKDGEFELARQRFEYVLSLNPAYPGGIERLAESMAGLFAAATPTDLPPTASPSPTYDPRPVQDKLAQAISLAAVSEWNGVLDSLISLRKTDSSYLPAQVDGLLYLALRNRGVDKILNQAHLQSGMYDLTLAEKFGPLDGEAENARQWARLYLIGSSFWKAYPEQAVYYFAQVTVAAPNLRDASGWTAMERYRESLIDWAEQFASTEDWCNASLQFETALGLRYTDAVQTAYDLSNQRCMGISETSQVDTITPTMWLTSTVTSTPTLPFSLTETPTPTGYEATPTEALPSDTAPPPVLTETPTPEEQTPTPTLAPNNFVGWQDILAALWYILVD